MKLDIVVPFYNEESCAKLFVEELLAELSSTEDLQLRLFAVNDGSSDDTAQILDGLAVNDDRINVIHLWGNHGHQKALIAGLDNCDADAVLMMDGDGQHPPETALEMIEYLKKNEHVDIVQALRKGGQAGFIKNAGSALFYKVMNLIMPDITLERGASDFRVIRKPVLDMIKRYPDRYRNLRVLLASLKLPNCFVDYAVVVRFAGASRYDARQMLTLAADGWFAFSISPLRTSLFLMLASWLIVFAYLVYVLVMYFKGNTVPGWASIVALITFMFSAVFGVLAIISEYVARIYTDVRGHPVYTIRLIRKNKESP
jgi:polyisoprenyl-phosphate glycosyltransferase